MVQVEVWSIWRPNSQSRCRRLNQRLSRGGTEILKNPLNLLLDCNQTDPNCSSILAFITHLMIRLNRKRLEIHRLMLSQQFTSSMIYWLICSYIVNEIPLPWNEVGHTSLHHFNLQCYETEGREGLDDQRARTAGNWTWTSWLPVRHATTTPLNPEHSAVPFRAYHYSSIESAYDRSEEAKDWSILPQRSLNCAGCWSDG